MAQQVSDRGVSEDRDIGMESLDIKIASLIRIGNPGEKGRLEEKPGRLGAEGSGSYSRININREGGSSANVKERTREKQN